jgi:hypothetical protein
MECDYYTRTMLRDLIKDKSLDYPLHPEYAFHTTDGFHLLVGLWTSILSLLPEPIDAIGGPSPGESALAFSGLHAYNILCPRNDIKCFSVPIGAVSPAIHLTDGDKVVVVDDILTTGNALAQTIDTIKNAGAHVVAAVVGIDGQQHNAKKRICRMIGGKDNFHTLFLKEEVDNPLAPYYK